MKVGHLIRAERIRQKMKQVVLARGICTPSYLSKIERNQIAPSEEIAILLFNKLEMDIDTIQEKDYESEAEIETFLKDTYKKILTVRNEDFRIKKLKELELKNLLFENDSHHYSFQLILLRLRLILGIDLETRKKEIDNLTKLSSNFNPRHIYMFNVAKAIYYYSVKNRRQAIEYLEEVLHTVDDISLDVWEKAELNYMIGLIYTADNRIFIAIEHIRKALGFFQENFLMNRVLECYVLIGVTQKRSDQFEEAFESYYKAKQLCDEFNLDSEKGLVYHNLGSLYGTMGKSKEAIEFLMKAINSKKEMKTQLISILGIIIEYSKINDKSSVNEWCKKGIFSYNQLKDDSLISYYHHFNFFKSLHSKSGLSEEIAIEAIEHFKKIQDHQYINKYSIALAEWYFTNRKYKLSSILYNEANRYGYIYRKNQKWEDL
ncbi:tetratricopeptide repeat protein [Sporosarcina sp. Marseille-Q4063]|uniref:tetratricopeptide repeat protein n=1 Tax=Sporosarcina sp. Marseille-Q4063 TaxID=2810514 RepID=UPI001BAEF33C|nr:tetratricopeptide repeat protein [Sporosarcina sp. Marseille-Q4063]QUW21597.1 tetratricopeptide repeat protein [Sporosarcina sp. Marseille-Q4063]